MATITVEQVKKLRERTGAGMMECKRALEMSAGNLDLAVEELRKSGRAKADKKADRIAAEGVIAILSDGKQAAMVEVNSETDFVSRDAHFTAFVKQVVETVLQTKVQDVMSFAMLPLSGHQQTVEEARQELVAKVGENVQVRRMVLSRPNVATVGTYLHGNRIGVMVELDTDNQGLARDIAMHIAASKPMVITPESVPAEVVEKEKEIYLAQAASSGKPQDIIEKMVAGRLKRFLDETSLVGQPFVKDPEVTVGHLLNKQRARVLAFYRFEVGEGIEKATEDFKTAVMSQVQGG
jgi:elongation factor Ts